MLVDLKRFNSVGDKPGIDCFMRIVFSDVCIKEDAARELCELHQGVRLNFDAAESFFVEVGWLDASGGMLCATSNCAYRPGGAEVSDQLCRDCLKTVVEKGMLNLEAVEYDVESDHFVLKRHAFSMSSSLYRNILLQLGALHEVGGGFLLAGCIEESFKAHVRSQNAKMTLDRLREIQQRQAELGERGELFVLEFERVRLSNTKFSKSVKRISEVDVAAGYDIVSYAGNESTSADRFIEVKTYVGAPHFFWSANERQAAIDLGEHYVIALVSAEHIDEPGYEPTFIEDPYHSLGDAAVWRVSPTSYSVELIGDLPKKEKHHLILKDVGDELKYREWLPVYSLKAACGCFGRGEEVVPEGWVKALGVGKLDSTQFVVRAVGKSMEPIISDGDFCVMKQIRGGSAENKIVLVECDSASDPENGGAFVIKTFRSDNATVALESKNKDFPALYPDVAEIRVVGEFKCVLELD